MSVKHGFCAARPSIVGSPPPVAARPPACRLQPSSRPFPHVCSCVDEARPPPLKQCLPCSAAMPRFASSNHGGATPLLKGAAGVSAVFALVRRVEGRRFLMPAAGYRSPQQEACTQTALPTGSHALRRAHPASFRSLPRPSLPTQFMVLQFVEVDLSRMRQQALS